MTHRAEENFSDNPGHNIVELYDISVQVWFTTIKWNLISSTKKFE